MGIEIKIKRIKKGKKQKDLAKAVGISPQYLRLLEKGESNNPSREVMLKIAKELDSTVDELFFNNID